MESLIRVLDSLRFFDKNPADEIFIKKTKNLQDPARLCQEIQEILRFFPKVSRKSKKEQENARGVTEACGTTSVQKNRPKIRSNLTWQIEHVFGQSTSQKSVQKTKQAARGDDRTETRNKKPMRLENS